MDHLPLLHHRVNRVTLCCSSYILVSRRPFEAEAGKMGYGNIMRVETSGASEQTSQQDRLNYSGVKASHRMAEIDADRMEKYRSNINRVGGKYGIDPAIIAAIISRESRAGNQLNNGWGDGGNAWGLMQVDVNPNGGGHTKRGAWDSEEHLCQGTEILVYFIGRIGNKFPGWNTEQKLKGGIAAYNMGDGNVHSYENVDGSTTGYGNIMDVETTGASAKTAGQDGLGYTGVKASHKMAETDADRMEKYRSKINSVGGKYGIDPAIIAAIISRESRAGNQLKDGWGDGGNAWGLMQVDVNPQGGGHTKRGAWDSEEHLCQGAEILVDFIKQVTKKLPSWTKEQQLKGGIAAYNMGVGNVRTVANVDVGSTGGDYSNDVVARAQWYKTNKGY